uniref:Uncharacterized protein n=1 Tax=uncultured Caudovirales phage TaxID=2100421 RepID=A0A6J5L3K8_9CAUD|nr:hypothetical protein UFOVP114_13 [uncultured Caudovirales phage]
MRDRPTIRLINGKRTMTMGYSDDSPVRLVGFCLGSEEALDVVHTTLDIRAEPSACGTLMYVDLSVSDAYFKHAGGANGIERTIAQELASIAGLLPAARYSEVCAGNPDDHTDCEDESCHCFCHLDEREDQAAREAGEAQERADSAARVESESEDWDEQE